MKIAFISFSYNGIKPYGASEYSERLLKSISNCGHQIDFFCPYPGRKFRKIKHINYIYIKSSNFPMLRFLSFSLNLARQMKNLTYDLIHSNGGAGLFLKSGPDFETFHHFEEFRIKSFFVSLNYIIYRFALHRARHIIAIYDQATNELIKKEKIERKYISLLYNSIDFSILKQNLQFDNLRNKYLENENQKILLCLGSFTERRKNQILSLKTLKFLLKQKIDSKLIMIGMGPLKKELRKYAMEQSIHENVIFIEYVKDVFPYYSIADLLLVPSLYEGFGYPFIEGPACGCKFISFKTGIAPTVEKYGLGYTVSSSQEFMNKALIYLNNPEKVKKEGIKFVMNNFSMNSFSQKLKRIYNNYLDVKKIKSK